MFDKAKLEALRSKYEGAKETEVAPAEFRNALSLVFGSSYRRAMPFAGLSALLDLPYRPEAADLPDCGELDGSKFHHGGPFRQAVLAGVLDPERTIQIGIRGPAEIFWGFSYESGMTVLHIEDVDRIGIDGVVAKAREVVGGGPTYISFDVDGLDPAFTPGTGTPETGGLTPREAQAILHGLKGVDIIGGDVVEVAPQYDPTTNTAMVGAQMLFEIFSLMVLAPRSSNR